ncbi:hypothetical protein CK503_07165 [Aliifodinibius salipaludis]|uniref:Uncharacterized protein n=1 Tax=Fodinibius salipaludis TaxID=2032627 RepID=A0A2A2G9Y8_9BACT|nr:hypothetical protein [Aliifodinibius salipaludis]PAU94566.1 hypothetical protein CK503_07165 [Aliifodinibius salipaludis]
MKTDFSFPHPVLGSNDDIEGKFNVNLSITREPETREIVFKFVKLDVNNDYFDHLLNKELAGPFVKIYCSSTLNTWTFYNQATMKINEDEIINHVDIDVRILSLVDGLEYFHESFNSQYGKQKFIVNKNDVLGTLDKERVPIPKEDEKLGLGNIFKFKTHDNSDKALEVDATNDEYIEITYPPLNGEHPHTYMFKTYPWTAYNIFILPALEEAFRFIDEQKETASQFKWFNVIDKLLPEKERTGNHFIDAQILLEGEIPLLKSYKEISKN